MNNNSSTTPLRSSARLERLSQSWVHDYLNVERAHGIVSMCTRCDSNRVLSLVTLGPDDLYQSTPTMDPETQAMREAGLVWEPTVEAGVKLGRYLDTHAGAISARMFVDYTADPPQVMTEFPQGLEFPDWVSRDVLNHYRNVGHLAQDDPAFVPLYWDIPTEYLVGHRNAYATQKDYDDEIERVRSIQESARFEASNARSVSAHLRHVPHAKQTDIDMWIIDADTGRPLVAVEETSNPNHPDTAMMVTRALVQQTYDAESNPNTETMFVDIKSGRDTHIYLMSPTRYVPVVLVPKDDDILVGSIIREWLTHRVFVSEGEVWGYDDESGGRFGVLDGWTYDPYAEVWGVHEDPNTDTPQPAPLVLFSGVCMSNN